MTYEQFIESKKHSSVDMGFDPVYYPSIAFDHQKHVIEMACKRGRMATFLDTGLGKTLISLSIAENIVRIFNKKVLILTPLAVAFQFIKESDKLGIEDVEYSKNGKFTGKIIITNYERLHYFNEKDFKCVILDESSILKNYDGKIKNAVTSFMKKVDYRFLATATPSPNDYIELGTSSEALGSLGYTDMLGKFFKNNNNSIDIRHAGCEWYLKPHAEADFWKWVSSWSISVRKPSDLGFSDIGYDLPELLENTHYIKNHNTHVEKNGQSSLFRKDAVNFFDIKKEVRQTINERCEKAVNVASGHKKSVYWVNLNDESSIIKSLDKSAYEIKGSMSIDKKEEILLAFSNGDIDKLITKTSITAFGLNWQHCNHTTYFPTYSYEKYYQAIRRFWRFGQKSNVSVDLILSEGQKKVMDSLTIKKEKAINMFEHLVSQTSKLEIDQKTEVNKIKSLPKFL